MEIETSEISHFRYGAIGEIAKKFGVSRQSVSNALKFRNNSKLSQDIRVEAIEKHGARLVTFKREM